MKKKIKIKTRKKSKKKTKSIKRKILKKKINRKNPSQREERINELKLRLKKVEKELKGGDGVAPSTYGSTEWLLIQGEITRLKHSIDDLNYMTDEEYLSL